MYLVKGLSSAMVYYSFICVVIHYIAAHAYDVPSRIPAFTKARRCLRGFTQLNTAVGNAFTFFKLFRVLLQPKLTKVWKLAVASARYVRNLLKWITPAHFKHLGFALPCSPHTDYLSFLIGRSQAPVFKITVQSAYTPVLQMTVCVCPLIG